MVGERTPLWDRPTFVYRFFAADDVLLYVGISDDWKNRCEQHRARAPWYQMATYLTVEQYENRRLAFAAESWALAYEDPKWNTEAQWKWCPFIPPKPDVAFGRRVAHYDFHGRELSAVPYAEGGLLLHAS